MVLRALAHLFKQYIALLALGALKLVYVCTVVGKLWKEGIFGHDRFYTLNSNVNAKSVVG
jgi:hypothetical protein